MPILAVPVVLAAIPVALQRTRYVRGARIVAGTLLMAFVVVTGFSIGLYYLPSAVAMTVAATSGQRQSSSSSS